MADRHAVLEYADLLRDFAVGKIPADRFQAEFLVRFKQERRPLGDAVFSLLDHLFADVDAFCSDSSLRLALERRRPGFYLGEAELRERTIKTLRALTDLQDSKPR